MNGQTALLQAIHAAKQQDWQGAVDCNTSILETYPQDLGALNRLGVAYTQLGQLDEAKATFEKVLELDRSNVVAKKNLAKLNSHTIPTVPAFYSPDFIEEPGKTKTVELTRLASRNVLDTLAVGQACELKPKNRYISVEMNGAYIGALPEDLSFRLSKLIETGNTYECLIQSASGSHCSVYIKETFRSPKNEHMNSFPLSKSSMAAINDVDDRFLMDDNLTPDGSEIPEADLETDKPLEENERLEE